jgi:hypothetical protein
MSDKEEKWKIKKSDEEERKINKREFVIKDFGKRSVSINNVFCRWYAEYFVGLNYSNKIIALREWLRLVSVAYSLAFFFFFFWLLFSFF